MKSISKTLKEIEDSKIERETQKENDLGYYTQFFISLSPEKTSAYDIDFAISKAKYLIKRLEKESI